jgi:hypothetical protein
MSAYYESSIQQRLLHTLLGRITKTDIGSGGKEMAGILVKSDYLEKDSQYRTVDSEEDKKQRT